MDTAAVFAHVDHTLLKPTAVSADIETLCRQALRYHTASVCIPPRFVGEVKRLFGDTFQAEHIAICTVIGFPLGYNTTAVKVAETREAVADGADEIDMVVSLSDVKAGDFDRVTDEIRAVKAAADGRILKVIIETCYLTESEKIALCRCVSDAHADFIKTSTGFGDNGAVLEDIALFKAHIAPDVHIKAAGGIRTREDMEAFLEAGCERIGTSGAVRALCESD
ncbi:MAG: deoxyribose-phosphate aldolase [Acutalibacteraceae bacterium]